MLLIDVVLEQWRRQDESKVPRWSFFLCSSKKIPYHKKGERFGSGHNSAVNTEDEAREMFGNASARDFFIGVAAGAVSGGVLAVDIDVKKENTPPGLTDLETIKLTVENNFGDLPKTESQTTKSGGEHLFYIDNRVGTKNNVFDFSRSGLAIDIKGSGGYFILYNYDINFENVSDAPEWICEKIKFRNSYDGTDSSDYTGLVPLCEEMEKDIHEAFLFLDYNDRDSFVKYGMALKTLNSDEARNIWLEWASRYEGYSEKYALSKWQSFLPTEISISTLFYDAKEKGYKTSKGDLEVAIQKQELLITTSKPRFELKDGSHIFMDRPPIEWIVKDLFVKGGLSIIAGDAGGGKTWASLDLAVSIALGLPWIGMEVEQSPVLIIDEESGDHRLATRLKKVALGHGGDSSIPVFYFTMQSTDIQSALDLHEIEQIIIEKNINFVVIDALMDVIPGANENDSKDMVHPLNAIKKIIERTGCSFLIIHHKTKPGKDKAQGTYRGSSAIKGACDLMVEIHRKPESDIIKFETTKVRDGEPTSFNAEMIFTECDFKLVHSESAVEKKITKQFSKVDIDIFKFLTNNPKSGSQAVTDSVKGLFATIRSHLDILTSKGLLIKEKSGIKNLFSIHPDKHFDIKIIMEKGFLDDNEAEID